MIPNNLTFDQMVSSMEECEQTKDISVLQHGLMVKQKFDQIIDCIQNNKSFNSDWRIPEFTKDLIPFLLDIEIIAQYQIFHDCGKPYCLEIDENGRRHFPNHAEVSHKVWSIAGGDPVVGELIRRDMDIHLLKAKDIKDFADNIYASTLLITGIAEVHANAEMFGGFDSDSFKIKIKHIEKRGKQIIKLL